jgi:hypothetical protein
MRVPHGGEFERLTAGLNAETSITSSAPLSFESVCLYELGPNACFVTQANVVGPTGDFACTEEQVDELEAVFARYSPPGGGDAASAFAALMQRLQSMREELKTKLSQSQCDRI